jgi:hypothetical protein
MGLQPLHYPRSAIRDPRVRRHGATLLGVTLLLLAACSGTPRRAALPEPPLQLESAGPLELPGGCEPERGVVYRTAFTVRTDGTVSAPVVETGSGCVQDALRQWVATFRYKPIAQDIPTVFDWLSVTASRGG